MSIIEHIVNSIDSAYDAGMRGMLNSKEYDDMLRERNAFQSMYLKAVEENIVLRATLEELKQVSLVEASKGSAVWEQTCRLICEALDP